MIMAFTALGETPESPVDPRFGRARYFLLHDSESATWSVHDNRPTAASAQDAGGQTTRHLIGLGVQAVVTGHCGPRAFTALKAAGVDVFQNASGSVRDALAAVTSGALKKLDRANVDAKYGSEPT